jgi:hypothetical protein
MMESHSIDKAAKIYMRNEKTSFYLISSLQNIE